MTTETRTKTLKDIHNMNLGDNALSLEELAALMNDSGESETPPATNEQEPETPPTE